MNIEIKGLEKLTPNIQKKLPKLLNKLKKKLPLKKDLVVSVKKLKGYCGGAWTSNGKHRIELNQSPCYTCARDTIIHEWAHLLNRSLYNHMDNWGIIYAKCYRISISKK